MSWIIARRKGRDYQMYCDADIYGRGHFGGEELTDLPVLYPNRREAYDHLRTLEKEKDWLYEVEYYE